MTLNEIEKSLYREVESGELEKFLKTFEGIVVEKKPGRGKAQ